MNSVPLRQFHVPSKTVYVFIHKALFFSILGLRIFFQNIKVGGGKKIKIKITNFFFLFNLKHIWIGGKKITKIVLFYTVKMQKWHFFFIFIF